MADQDGNKVQDIRDLANPNWGDSNDRRRIAACLVKIVYQLEKGKRKEKLVKEWCKMLNFKVEETMNDETIFGAIFKWVGSSKRGEDKGKPPSQVVAFRGTIPKTKYILGKDFFHNWKAANACHNSIARADIGLKYLKRSIDNHGHDNIWIVGHSLGAAIAIVVARKMEKEKIDKIEAHLFNPPFLSPRLPELKLFELAGRTLAALRDTWVKLDLGLPNALDYMMINDRKLRGLYDDFIGVSGWIPNIYVNRNDLICCSYIRYFEVMGVMYKQENQQLYKRMKYLFCFEIAEDKTPWHLIPSAKLFVRDSSDHRLPQWWCNSLKLEVRNYVPPAESKK